MTSPYPTITSAAESRNQARTLGSAHANGCTQRWQPRPKTVQGLYQRAAALEHRWPGLSVSDTPGRMVDAVLREVPRLIESGKLSPQEANDPRRLSTVLDFIWTRNARRDYSRSQVRPRLVLSEALADPSDSFEPVHDQHLLRRVFRYLIGAGNRREVVTAFLLTSQGLDSEEIATMLSRAGHLAYQPTTVRQWRRRAFPRMRDQLQRSPALFSLEVRS